MAKRILASLVFAVLMAIIIAGSLVVVVFLYLPFVVLKALAQMAKGKARLKVAEPAAQR